MILKNYICELNKQYCTGLAREHSYRPALHNLISTLLPDIVVTNEPARIECGAPDFIISRQYDNTPVAFIEAKDIDDTDLDGRKQHKSQFSRYKESLDHIIFTDYLDFHFYENGELIEKIRIAEVQGNKIVGLCNSFEKFVAHIKALSNSKQQKIVSAGKLAKIMASKAKLLAEIIRKVLDVETDYTGLQLKGQYEAFKNVLLHYIDHDSFADIYAQTITYGMFAARMHEPTAVNFTRQRAATLIPKTNPFLRQIFQTIAGYDLDERIVWIVDDLALSFAATDMSRILKGYGGNDRHSDPMIHFYEDFLANYNPKLRKTKGVWYTPSPIVNFIVRSIDEILKRTFNLPMGLADYSEIEHEIINENYDPKLKDSKYTKIEKYHKVQLLDPAVGTGTFLAAAINCIYDKFSNMHGMWQSYVEKHLLPRLNGFEILMAPYAIAHLKIDWLLSSTGYSHDVDHRIKVYLTNSLEEYHKDNGTMFSMWLSQEANEARRIKRDTPVMVLFGNPPYNGSSTNNGKWIMELLNTYKKEPYTSHKLKERNYKYINDDYVKFIRMAQYFIEQNGEGVIAYVNPHGFLDNPTFRGMRSELLRVFDAIYTIDLHGNSNKKEVSPDGGKDENVFGIKQGVSINFFIKTNKQNCQGKIFHYELYGKKSEKYAYLNNNSITTVPYTELNPQPPNYYFVPKNFTLESEYKQGFALNELFLTFTLGPKSHRDDFAISFDQTKALKRICDLRNSTISDDEIRSLYNIADNRDWSLAKSRLIIKPTDVPIKCLYRPFDYRWMLYGEYAFDYPRQQVNDHLIIGDNLALVFTRQTKEQFGVFSIKVPLGQHKIVSSYDSSYFAPLFYYSDSDGSYESINKIVNFNSEIIDNIETVIKEKVKPIELFDYVYGVLHTPGYIQKYNEFLKIDFPRVSYPKNSYEYHSIAAIGTNLRNLHTMEDSTNWKLFVGYPIIGTNIVERIIYKDNRVYINELQYFDNVPFEAWTANIGGYQPALKWLKERRGHTLDFEDIRHYQQIIYALANTSKIIAGIETT